MRVHLILYVFQHISVDVIGGEFEGNMNLNWHCFYCPSNRNCKVHITVVI